MGISSRLSSGVKTSSSSLHALHKNAHRAFLCRHVAPYPGGRMSDFGVDRKIYSAEMYDKINDFNYDLPFYLELCKSVKGSVLELCCGSGRLTLPLAQAGVDITGLDFTESMVQKAQEKFSANDLDNSIVQGDMRDFNLNKKFDLIFIPFNSIQNTYKFEDMNAAFSKVKEHLSGDGVFALDIFNPDFRYLIRDENEQEEIFNFKLDSGKDVRITQSMKYDKVSQVNRVKWHHHIDGEVFVERIDMRCFFPQEMDYILRYNGFEIISKFGDFEKGEFKGDSLKQIYICKVSGT